MTVKILISYHDNHPILKSDVLTPIQTGCVNAPELFDGMLRDDIGNNISDKNPNYCELTAQYWAWKNYDKLDNPDYIGFMHYRRQFMFDGWRGNPKCAWQPNGDVFYVPFITEGYCRHFADETIRSVLKEFDCVAITPYDLTNLKSSSCREQYGKLEKQKVENFDIFIQTAKEIAPDYVKEIEMIENGSVQYFCNMFVMSRNLFFRYNEFCFPILFETEKRIQIGDNDRTLGFLGEFLLTAFLFKLQTEQVWIKELPASYILSDVVYKYPHLSFFYYWFLSKIAVGERRKRHKTKRKEIKRILSVLKNSQALW
ncbi:MAG: DUF4422 domain-containing protein [Alphaproteobacteria bacterium]|nr:DUF4422 domain-containing protein [Alphaproteobacteria bacterium]